MNFNFLKELVAQSQLTKGLVEWNLRRVDRINSKKEGRTVYDHRFGVLGIMKNEALNVDEWIRHYRWQGAGKIYLIDNGSTDNTIEKVKPWIEAGIVELISLTEIWAQPKHYWTAIEKFKIRKHCEWLLIADLDEFWFCKDGKSLSAQLGEMDDLDVIYANWTMFGSAGHENHPDSLRLRLTRKKPLGSLDGGTKWIARTHVLSSRNAVQVHKVKGACSSRTYTRNDVFQINHYQNQSLEFWTTVKMCRGDVLGSRYEDTRQMENFHSLDAACTDLDLQLKTMCDSSPDSSSSA